VIVLDDEHIGRAREDAAELARACGVERCPGRVLRPWREDDGLDAARERPRQIAGDETRVVDRDGLRDETELDGAWDRLSRRVDDLGPRNDVTGFLIQEMAQGILEVFAGASQDPDFGLVLAFGAGGVLVEALDDVALRPLPLRAGDAAAMIAETRVATLLGGLRGRPPGDVGALARALEAIGDVAWAERESLGEVDVNPIVVREAGAGCVAVDALIVPRGRG